MAKSTVTPLELAKRYLIKIGVDKLIVEKSRKFDTSKPSKTSNGLIFL